MKRREFIWLLGASAMWPLEAQAQQPLRTIAIVGNTAEAYGSWAAALVVRLGQLGWIAGHTLQVEYRWSEGRRERVVEIAAELVSKKVDLIVTYGSAAVILKKVTASIPIVFVPAVDPVSAGLVADFAHPGGNVTGMSVEQAEIASKRVELLHEIVPGPILAAGHFGILATGVENLTLEDLKIEMFMCTLSSRQPGPS